jgi:hypothetical protein
MEEGFRPFPEPRPYQGQELALEIQVEHYARPNFGNGIGPVDWEPTGNCRLILTGHAARMQPYLEACRALWEQETF